MAPDSLPRTSFPPITTNWNGLHKRGGPDRVQQARHCRTGAVTQRRRRRPAVEAIAGLVLPGGLVGGCAAGTGDASSPPQSPTTLTSGSPVYDLLNRRTVSAVRRSTTSGRRGRWFRLSQGRALFGGHHFFGCIVDSRGGALSRTAIRQLVRGRCPGWAGRPGPVPHQATFALLGRRAGWVGTVVECVVSRHAFRSALRGSFRPAA